MTEKEKPSSYFRREEIRGLFVLGLLAVVASIRIQNTEMTIIIAEKPYSITLFLDIMLVLWSFYAFFMVLGFSEDIVGKKTSSMFREISTMYLYFSFVILAFLSIIFVYSVYPDRTPWALAFLPVLFGYLFIRNLKKMIRRVRFGIRKFPESVKSSSYQFLFSGFLLCFLLIMFGTREDFVVPSFIVGSVFLMSFLIAREKVKGKAGRKTEQKSLVS